MEPAIATNIDQPIQPHALVVAFPVQSHVGPMMHLAKMLASKGVKATFLLPRASHEQLAAAAATKTSSNYNEHLQANTSEEEDFKVVSFEDESGSAATRSINLLESLLQLDSMRAGARALVAEQKVTCLIADLFVPWAVGLAKECSIPLYSFCSTSALAFAAFAFVNPEHLVTIVNDKLAVDAPLALLAGLPLLHVNDYQAKEPGFPSKDFTVFCELMKTGLEADSIIINTLCEIEPATMEALRKHGLRMVPIGPCLPYACLDVQSTQADYTVPAFWETEDDRCLQWLHTRTAHSVIYISSGGVVNLSAHQITEIAMGVEQSGYAFLWVVRPDIAPSFHDALPEGFLTRTKDHGLLVSWAPQLKVLSHPAVGAFFCHFGWSSFLENICCGGIPEIGFPLIADQTMNSRALEECEVGMACMKGNDGVVGREEVKRAIKAMMEGEEGKKARDKAAEIKKAVSYAVREGGSTYENNEKLAEEIKSKAQQH